VSDVRPVNRVRDAMIPEPQTLGASASAQDAGGHLVQPDVRAVYVCEQGRFVGVVTRKTLVAEVVAAGRDPRETTVGEIAEPPNWTIDPELPLDEAFRRLEEWDAERVPVVDDGSLVGVLSRSVLRRRLAEDEPPAAVEDL
jgi:CBS domain-containing protein